MRYTVDKKTGLTVETKEAKEMKEHWQRGLLLGVSIALLLSGGVALAASVSVEANQPCFVCIPRADYPPSGDQLMELTLRGYDPNEELQWRLTMAGTLWRAATFNPTLMGPPCGVQLYVRCEDLMVGTSEDCEGNSNAAGVDAEGTLPPAVHGQWVFRIEQGDNGDVDTASFRFAEVCEVEFVPEPGTIMLLGSGLAGLAGYATLRWRARE